MKRVLMNFAFAGMLVISINGHAYQAAAERPALNEPEEGRVPLSPAAMAPSADGHTVFIACATADQVLRFDTATGRISRRVKLPAAPSGLALSEDGTRLYVTCAGPESRVCVINAASGKIVAVIPTGHTAMAPVLARDEKTLFVCNRFNDSVAVIDLRKQKEVARIGVEREPVAAAITPDGRFLFVANHIHSGRADVGVVAAAVTVIDVGTGRVLKQIPLPNGSTLSRGICVSPDGRFVALTHILARFHLPATQVEHGWMNDNALSLIDVEHLRLLNTVLLDNVDRGAANPWAVAWSADGKHLCVTHAGTHELSVIDAPALLAKLSALPTELGPNAQPDGGTAARTTADVPSDLAFLLGVRTRVKLMGNGPRSLALIGNRALVANYFSDSLSTVDLDKGSLVNGPVVLGPPVEPSLVRRGEMFFNDGTLCFQSWQSCASCHSSDGRVDGMDWDLPNDGLGNPKNVKSLLLAFDTGPAMALGVRTNAAAAVRAGIRHILFAELPDEYPAAIDDYLQSLRPIPSPHLVRGQLTPAAQRGKKLFFDSRVGCAACHVRPLYTDLRSHEIGTGKFDDARDRFYTPTLIEVWRTAPYLHDGSAATLREVMTTHNPRDRRGHTSGLNEDQVNDLVAFVESL
jgi:YVTN family beta-propeller protein